jgi:hypothetical protein
MTSGMALIFFVGFYLGTSWGTSETRKREHEALARLRSERTALHNR